MVQNGFGPSVSIKQGFVHPFPMVSKWCLEWIWSISIYKTGVCSSISHGFQVVLRMDLVPSASIKQGFVHPFPWFPSGAKWIWSISIYKTGVCSSISHGFQVVQNGFGPSVSIHSHSHTTGAPSSLTPKLRSAELRGASLAPRGGFASAAEVRGEVP